MVIKKFIYIIVLLVTNCLVAMAIPAFNVRRDVRQPDNTILMLYLKGDEYCSGYFTTDNIYVIEKEDGWYYAICENGSLVASSVMAHNEGNRAKYEQDLCNANRENVLNIFNEIRRENLNERSKGNELCAFGKGLKFEKSEIRKVLLGKKKGLVILVQYPNQMMKAENPQYEFDQMFNEIGYSKNNHIGSVHDYFYDQSYGQFDVSFDVVGPFTLSQNYEYYGAKTSQNNDRAPGTMIAEACSLADPYVNYSDYDWNGDGEVENIFVVYAGYAESSGAPSGTIWPHKSNLSMLAKIGDGPGALTLDGVVVDMYACSSELTGVSGTIMRGIGTACHEFSHCLGFPDMYDTNYNGSFGMDCWDLMNSGSYNGPNYNGEIPCGYSAYERWVAGWLDIEELKEACVIRDLPCVAEEKRAYIVYNDNNKDEFFILENRQSAKWFSYIANMKAPHGLLITHIDYNEYFWNSNTVNNNPKHQRITIVPADNSYGYTEAEYLGDVFPGKYNVTSFMDGTHSVSAGNLFNKNTDGSYYLHKPLELISEKDGKISFYFKGGMELKSPESIKIRKISKSGFTVTWDKVDNAEAYTLELSESVAKKTPFYNVIISENFAKFKSLSSIDGFEDLSENLNSYTISGGWKGYKVFSSPNGVKLSTSSTEGYLMTPSFVPSCSSMSVKLIASAYSTLGAELSVKLLNKNNITLSCINIHITKTSDTYIVFFDNINEGIEYKISVASSGRSYISDIGIFNDTYELEDFNNVSMGMTMKVKTVETDITDTSYTFTDLEVKKYKLRLQATTYPAKSEWTDYVEVELKELQSGDCNGDGVVDIEDAKMITNYYLGIKEEDFLQEQADVNNDGDITIADANYILNIINCKPNI